MSNAECAVLCWTLHLSAEHRDGLRRFYFTEGEQNLSWAKGAQYPSNTALKIPQDLMRSSKVIIVLADISFTDMSLARLFIYINLSCSSSHPPARPWQSQSPTRRAAPARASMTERREPQNRWKSKCRKQWETTTAPKDLRCFPPSAAPCDPQASQGIKDPGLPGPILCFHGTHAIFWMLQKSACTRQKACYTVNVNVRMYYTIQTMGCCSDWRKSNIGTSRLRCQYPDSEIKHWTVEHLSIACLIPWYFVVSLVDFPFQEAKESLRAFTFIHRWLSASSNQRKHQHKRSHSVDHRLRRLRIVDFCHHAFALTTASTTHDIDGRSLLSVRFLCFDDPTITISPSNLLVPMHMNHCQSIHVRIEQISAWPSRL